MFPAKTDVTFEPDQLIQLLNFKFEDNQHFCRSLVGRILIFIRGHYPDPDSDPDPDPYRRS